jgi:DNA-binding response OmpR family regulator
MSASILVIEYEPRYVEHVRKALAGPDFHLEISGNVDDAVNRCASFEADTVIVTSDLPNLKIEDAIVPVQVCARRRF